MLHYAVCTKYAITVLEAGIGTTLIKIRPPQTRWHGTPLIMEGAPPNLHNTNIFCGFFFGLASVLLAEGSVLGPCYEIWEELR